MIIQLTVAAAVLGTVAAADLVLGALRRRRS